jgi:hypothetical protein
MTFVGYYTILLYYLILCGSPRHVFHRIRGFSKQSIYFGFNSTEQESMFSVLLSSRAPFGRQTDPIYLPCHFCKETKIFRRNKSMGNTTRSKRAPTMWSHFMAAWWGPPPTSWVLFQIYLPLRNHLDLKPTIYMSPGYFAMGWQRNIEYKIQI